MRTPVWVGKSSPAIITLIDEYNFLATDLILLFATLRGLVEKKQLKRWIKKYIENNMVV